MRALNWPETGVFVGWMGLSLMLGFPLGAEARIWDIGVRGEAQGSDLGPLQFQFQANISDQGSASFTVNGFPVQLNINQEGFSVSVEKAVQEDDCFTLIKFGGSGSVQVVSRGFIAYGILTGNAVTDCFGEFPSHDVFSISGEYMAVSQTERVAEVTGTVGTVEIRTPTGFQTIAPGYRLGPGSLIRTGAGGRATVEFEDGSRVEVGENSSFVVAMKDGETRINQINGFLRHLKRCLATRGCNYIRTPTAAVGVRGTQFTTEYSEVAGSPFVNSRQPIAILPPFGTTRVTVQEGVVDVTDRSGNATPVTAGGDLILTDPVPRISLILPADEDFIVKDIVHTLNWTAFQGAPGYLLEFVAFPPGFARPNSPAPEPPASTSTLLVMPGQFAESDGIIELGALFQQEGDILWRVFPADSAGEILPGTQSSDAFALTIEGGRTPLGPDLTGNWLDLAQDCQVKKGVQRCKLRGRVQVINQGVTKAAKSRLRFYLSYDAILDAGDTSLKQVKVGALLAGQSQERQLSVKLRKGVNASGRVVLAVIDANNQVPEDNELNNVPSWWIP